MGQLRKDAKDAQDNLGWAPMPPDRNGGTEFAEATIDLARMVVELAREIEALKGVAS